MNIFDQYGIKEVADVTLYSIHKKQDGSGEVYYVPALYLDTLKISTVEKTAENVWAQGGLGNARLISWDYGKQINVTLEDALCTPASLGLCWNGALSADWKDAEVKFNTDVCYCQNPVTRISRMEKAIYPRQDKEGAIVSNLLPRLVGDPMDETLDLLKASSIVDGTEVKGFGLIKNHTYKWKMAIESAVKSIAVVPDRFFDIKGRSYPIDINRKISVSSLPTYENYKDAIIYKINSVSGCDQPRAKIIFDDAMEPPYETTIEELQAIYGNKIKVEDWTINIPINMDYDYPEDPNTNSWTFKNAIFLLDDSNKKVAVLADSYLYKQFSELVNALQKSILNLPPHLGGDVYVLALLKRDTLKVRNNEGKFFSFVSKTDKDNTQYIADVYDVKYYDQKASTNETEYVSSYKQNRAMTSLFNKYNKSLSLIPDQLGSVELEIIDFADIKTASYLAIIVDSNDDYHALIGVTSKNYPYDNKDYTESNEITWYRPSTEIDVMQFKGIDMWLRFQSINELIYFLITKYEQNILTIQPSTINANEYDNTYGDGDGDWAVNKQKTTVEKNTDGESKKLEGRLWSYINPRTMSPYPDDYWFHQGEPLYVKSLIIAPKNKKLKGNRIIVRADQWPGMYMMVGETYIRSRDTGEDERMQIKFPLCKVKSDHTLTLEAEGDPTTFNLDLEVARPASGVMMELTSYEIAERMLEGDNGCFYAVDGSTQVLSE